MDFGRLEEKRTPLTGRMGAGNRRRRSAWDQRGVARDLDESAAELADQGLGRGGRTRSNNRPTAAEKRLIQKAEKTEKAWADAKKKSLPGYKIKQLERVARRAARDAAATPFFSQSKGSRRAW